MTSNTFDLSDKKSVNTLIGKVYGYMFFGILLTAVIAFGVGILFNLWIFGTINVASINYQDVTTNINRAGATTLLVVLAVSGISLFVMSFVVHFVFLRGKHSLAVPLFIYCVLMGLTLASLVIFVPWPVLAITFGITSGIYGIMYLIATLSKGNLSSLGIIGIGLLLGAGLIGLVGMILMMTGALGSQGAMTLYWIISFMSFAAIMFVTIWDMWRIKKIAEQGEMSDNLVLYCAFNLYVDFIYLFLQVLRIVSYFYSKK